MPRHKKLKIWPKMKAINEKKGQSRERSRLRRGGSDRSESRRSGKCSSEEGEEGGRD